MPVMRYILATVFVALYWGIAIGAARLLGTGHLPILVGILVAAQALAVADDCLGYRKGGL